MATVSIKKSVSRGQQLAALALLILLLGGFAYLLISQWTARYCFYQEHLQQQQGRLAQLERMASSREPIQQMITNIQQDRNAVAQYLPQATPSIAAAELQQRVKTVIESTGGALRSIQPLPPTEEGRIVKIAVSVNLAGNMEGLQKILHELESQTPLLFIDNLEVIAREERPRLTNGRMANYTRIQLSIQLEVSGYLRKEGV